MDFDNLKKTVEKLSYKKDNLIENIEENNLKIEKLSDSMNTMVKARWILAEVTKKTQINFKNQVEKLTTIALKSVFNADYEFKLLFETKRNKMEARAVILENGVEFEPKNEMGGSILDLISFMLQITFIFLEKPSKRKVIILDEPFRFLGELKSKAGKMLKEISIELGIQIIFVTHDDILSEVAGTIYHVTKDNNISNVKRIK